MAKKTLTLENFERLKKLCNLEDGIYVQKSGQDYIDVLSVLFHSENKNDFPFTTVDVKRAPTLDSFNFDGKYDFEYICELHAQPMTITQNREKNNERIIACNFKSKDAQKIFNESLGVAYMITGVIDDVEHIIKFGQTRTPFSKRLQSYNCGTVTNWRTASTTNIKMLQSMVATRIKYKLYLYPCTTTHYHEWRGEKSGPFAGPESLAVEDIMIKKYEQQYHKLPLANIQANPTAVDE